MPCLLRPSPPFPEDPPTVPVSLDGGETGETGMPNELLAFGVVDEERAALIRRSRSSMADDVRLKSGRGETGGLVGRRLLEGEERPEGVSEDEGVVRLVEVESETVEVVFLRG